MVSNSSKISTLLKKGLCFAVSTLSVSVMLCSQVPADTSRMEGGDTGSADGAGQVHERVNYFERHTGYQPGTVQLREVPQSTMDSVKRDDAFWYANKSFATKKGEDGNLHLPSQWMNLPTLVIIVVIFIGLIGWYLFQNNIIGKKRAVIRVAGQDAVESESIFDIDYEHAIQSAIQVSDYRLATRLLFLRLLKSLSEKEIIRYKPDRTNFDYLAQLRPGGYYSDFFRLVRNYEFAWYGKFDVSAAAFNVIQRDFETFYRRLP